jgi:adenine-specific DNA-methyltransferase
VPAGFYVLVKRFSAKEERRRIVAAIYDPARVPAEAVAFENHLNYYHRNGSGLPERLAKGLAAFLNSTLVDLYFRQFNGHTQVNATDLRSLNYPTEEELEALGSSIAEELPSLEHLDQLVGEVLFSMAEPDGGPDPVLARRKIEEALAILKDLGLPRGQLNERSALVLLSLLDLTPEKPWSEASAPMRGIQPMMDYFAEHYGKKYAENTRESVRRYTVHQFLDAGLIVINPDDPSRPVNSGKTVYQIEASALDLMRAYGTEAWNKAVQRRRYPQSPLRSRTC